MRRSTPLIFFTALVVLTTVGAGSAFPQNTKENADLKLALNLYNDGLFDLALEQLKQFIAAYPNTSQGVEARYTLGLSQLKLKQYEDARITFQTFALTYQDNARAPEAWWNVGECYAAQNNPKEAALAFERVKVFHPKSKSAPDALVRAAFFFGLAGEKDNARRLLRTVLQEYPASGAVIAARTQLGRIYFEEGNVELAQNELKRVIDGDPSADARAQALLILGNIQQEMGKSEAAQSHYQEIITTYKTSSALQGAYVHVARLNAAGGKHAEAIDNLKKALALTKNIDTTLSKEALRALGDAYAATGNAQNAVSSYGRFLDAYPSDAKAPDVLRSLATAAARARDFRQSNEASVRLLRSDPPDDFKRFALLRLAWNAREQKSPATALQYFNRYTDLYPDDPSTPAVLFETGTLVEKDLHDPRKASAVYELLATRHPHADAADDALFGAARCQEQLREYDRALQTYREVTLTYSASDLVDSAAARVRMIETFEAKNKDAGLEKLALLVGDVVSEKDRTGFAFRLGEIYFHDIKNYDAAAPLTLPARPHGGALRPRPRRGGRAAPHPVRDRCVLVGPAQPAAGLLRRLRRPVRRRAARLPAGLPALRPLRQDGPALAARRRADDPAVAADGDRFGGDRRRTDRADEGHRQPNCPGSAQRSTLHAAAPKRRTGRSASGLTARCTMAWRRPWATWVCKPNG